VLLQSLARGDRMDWIVQKTTELGVAAIIPVAAGRSVARVEPGAAAPRRARWEKIAREAARQCGRADVPIIREPLALAGALDAGREEARGAGAQLALWEASRGRSLRQALATVPESTTPTVTLLIGPEGGFAASEMSAATDAGFEVVGLGPRILRVETAAVVAVALAQAAAGGLD
jgi:16S rRNA (uracil1498-N3)-methyltransferase